MTDTSKQCPRTAEWLKWINEIDECHCDSMPCKEDDKCGICYALRIMRKLARAEQSTETPPTDRLTHISFVVTGNDHALMDMTSQQVDEALENYAKRYMEDHNG